MKEKQELFVFNDFFFTKPDLYIHEDENMEDLRKAYNSPREYKSIDNINFFDLNEIMSDPAIVNNIIGGKKELIKNFICMSQIEKLIKNQPRPKIGNLLDNGYSNLFYVPIKNNIFVVVIHARSHTRKWYIRTYKYPKNSSWLPGRRVFY